MKQGRSVRSEVKYPLTLRPLFDQRVRKWQAHSTYTVSSGKRIPSAQRQGNPLLTCSPPVKMYFCFPNSVDLGVAVFILHLTPYFHQGCLDYAKIQSIPEFQLLNNNTYLFFTYNPRGSKRVEGAVSFVIRAGELVAVYTWRAVQSSQYNFQVWNWKSHRSIFSLTLAMVVVREKEESVPVWQGCSVWCHFIKKLVIYLH